MGAEENLWAIFNSFNIFKIFNIFNRQQEFSFLSEDNFEIDYSLKLDIICNI